MKVMILTGSNRKEATSTKLAEHAAHFISQHGKRLPCLISTNAHFPFIHQTRFTQSMNI
ncbi:hypothetical protein [Paenibacillus odorifer]|uniref:hypothetical protein n=1 Tax=Paenibacillus odorifer TaxID=189426 RepID=UPI00273E4D02|nr:hypothetical protein [Paenibacillus odorifer]